MSNLVRFGRAVGLGMGMAAGLASAGALVWLRRSLPQIRGKTTVPGLEGRVQILRDRWGVPHIYAGSNRDLSIALGYVHAQDRLWQMDLNRRTGNGELAEIFGPVALSSDRFMRVLGLGRVARSEVVMLDAATHELVEAYVLGINTFLALYDDRLPPEFAVLRYKPRPWSIADVLVLAKVMALKLSGNWASELMNARIVAAVGAERFAELSPRYPADGPVVVPEGIYYSPTIGTGALRAAAEAAPFINTSGGEGSNGWVVAGERSAHGAALLANDPHLGLALPGVWYLAHLEGGDFSVAGATMPGAPGVVIGHNTRIAWGVTNSGLDIQDLYIERFHPDDPLLYQWNDGWEQATLIREQIIVKERPDPVVEEVRITRHGPVIDTISTETGGSPARVENGSYEALALRWTALDPAPKLQRAVLALNRARDWDEFRTALADWNVPPQNFVYADVDGHYGYALGGAIPIRARGDGSLPMPGWDGAYEWQGYIANAALPAAYDPPTGMAVTANNRQTGAGYSFASVLHGEWLNGYRAARIQELLEAVPHHTADSFARIHSDVYSMPGRTLAALVVELAVDEPLVCQARDILAAWDGNLTTDSAGGAIYAALRYHLLNRVYAEISDLLTAPVGLGAFALLPGSEWLERALPMLLARIAAAGPLDQPDPWLGGGRSWAGVLRECLALSTAELHTMIGEDMQKWSYGQVHSLTLQHPLGAVPALNRLFNRGPWPMGGDLDTVSQGYILRNNPAGPSYNGPSYRQICDPGDWERSLYVIPGGQSGHPLAAHYLDMNSIWRSGGYIPMLWKRSRIEQYNIARLYLEPQHDE